MGTKQVTRHLDHDYFWSDKYKLNYTILTELDKKLSPINFRLYDKREGKTKKDDLREMVREVMEWG